MKVQANVIREWRDVNGLLLAGEGRQWSRLIRLQVGV
jgi:hypothetical protein